MRSSTPRRPSPRARRRSTRSRRATSSWSGAAATPMRCISPRVGGAFGTKIFLYPEYVLMAALAERVGRPVKWMESRRENYTATTHGRDHITDIEVGANRDGTITALKVHTYANLGGILSTIAPGIPTT